MSANTDDPVTLNALGIALARAGRWQEAASVIARAVRAQPENPITYNNLGFVQQQLGHVQQALRNFERALQLSPFYVEAHVNRGLALSILGRHAEALASHDAALAYNPLHPEANYHRGSALGALGRLEEALISYRHAAALKPDAFEIHNNLGLLLTDLGRHEAALECFDRAIALNPRHPEPHNARGIALHGLHRYEEARQSYERSITLQPDFAEAKWNLGLLLLALGALPQGWELTEARFLVKSAIVRARPTSKPVWLGSPDLRGKTLLLHGAEGLGDTLQFCRYAPLAKAAGARTLLEVQPALRCLLQSLDGVDEIVAPGDRVEEYDYHCPLLSLPLAFRTTLETIPREIPYLRPDHARQLSWAERLTDITDFRIGIAWQGNAKSERYLAQGRSIPLAHFARLAAAPGVRLVSLQKGEGSAQTTTIEFRDRLVSFVGELDSGPNAFVDTAAIMANLDLVITSDTSIAHLAGALGVPVWVALHFTPDWRWMIERDDSPWYPTMRLFRQPAWGDWDAVFAQMAGELSRVAQRLSERAGITNRA